MDKRVLLIDFDPVAAELTGALLATRGIPFTLARSHAELDRALAAGTPALVVIDPARPDENEGMRLCASLAERLGPARQVPIILASRSLHGARWKALARDAGAELFLERPKDDRLLLAAAERALGHAGSLPAVPTAAPSAAPPPVRTTSPASPGEITTASGQRTPPPPENELENMVDQMFAQWFADGDAVAPTGTGSATGPRTGGVASVPERGPTGAVATSARAAAAPVPRDTVATAATPSARNAGATVSAALLEQSGPAEADVERTPTGRVKSSAPTTSPIATPLTVSPRPALPLVPAVPRPAAGAPQPTGPVVGIAHSGPAVAKPIAPVAAPSKAQTAAVPASPVGPTAEVAPARPGFNLVRPVAIAAAVALIGIGVAFVALQKLGEPGEETADTAVAAPREAPPAGPQPAVEGPVVADAAAAPAIEAKKPPATLPPVSSAPTPPARPAAETGLAPREAQGTPASTGNVVPARSVPSDGAAPPPTASTPPPPTLTESAVIATPATTAAPPVPQPEAEFIPDVAPDGTLPAAQTPPDASLARYVGPELIAASRATPVFPAGARQMRMSGQVKLQLKVRSDGSVGAVTVISEPKPVVGFGKAAESAVRQWRYRPATLGSRAVESEVVVVVNFSGE